MKKFLLLLAAICYASCKTTCDAVEPANATVCHNAELEKTDENQCCFLKKDAVLSCHEFAKNLTADQVKEKNPEYKDYEIDCPYKGGDKPSSSNYLKAGFLLVAMLLL
jgi:hypothetical protein